VAALTGGEDSRILEVIVQYITKGANTVSAEHRKIAEEVMAGTKTTDQANDEMSRFKETTVTAMKDMTKESKEFKKEMNELYGEMRGVRDAAPSSPLAGPP